MLEYHLLFMILRSRKISIAYAYETARAAAGYRLSQQSNILLYIGFGSFVFTPMLSSLGCLARSGLPSSSD